MTMLCCSVFIPVPLMIDCYINDHATIVISLVYLAVCLLSLNQPVCLLMPRRLSLRMKGMCLVKRLFHILVHQVWSDLVQWWGARDPLVWKHHQVELVIYKDASDDCRRVVRLKKVKTSKAVVEFLRIVPIRLMGRSSSYRRRAGWRHAR